MDRNTSILSLYAISPIHAGSGAAVSTVDLPIQRERITNYPCIQASALKGAMRSHFRDFISKKDRYHKSDSNKELINYIFGSDEQDKWSKNDDSMPGAISVSDAKLLAFPMRSNIAPFVCVICPTIIKRLKRDLEFAGLYLNDDDALSKPDLSNVLSGVINDTAIVIKGNFKDENSAAIILEDAVVKINTQEPININFINDNFPEIDYLLLISDEMFDYCISNCTEIQTNVKINSETGTSQDGALRYQEFLPSDTLLYSVVNFKDQRAETKIENYLKANIIKNYVEDIIKEFIQIGGGETLGKGICKIKWIPKNKNEQNNGGQK
ncbi:MAG: type III-B CRISPR module RAMP protein Cmr4 [Candidatus Acididesulfobacter diazotrophicus]|uniref:Type III-B CRISPR module RAMP protein Cmr4 n=1 Tax=Candidatus Acididesulfobacter diazotrophicus TaxID=2597226 RepID=A0A519BQC1_9DELT|nr:MAG: type III-B CRISPR module RAMP protein Cmr4 [Candidatus Acididesulfobacter diazotrophicus]